MNDYEIKRIVKAEYYGDKQLASQYANALQRIESMIQETSFTYKCPKTRTATNRTISLPS